MERRITVVGSTNIDMIVRLERLPAPGETVGGGQFLQAFGGKGANQAVAAARAGGQVAFVTCLGEDALAAQLLAALRADGVATEHVARAAGAPTGTAVVLLDARGENCIALAPGANDALTPAHIDACADLIGGSAMLLAQMEVAPAATRRALELASARGVPTLLNFAPARADALGLSPAVGGLVVNEVEAEALAGCAVRDVDGAATAAAALLARGPRFVIVTLGAGGLYLAGAGLGLHIPAFPVAPVDSTAAGDAFCGALPEAARFASAAAALSVTRLGAQPSLPRRAEIDAFLAGR